MAYWQIAAGSEGRDYSEYFLKYGIAFVGGEFNTTMEQVEEGDIVVLKIGKTMKAVGTVVKRNGTHRGCGDKEWLRDFDGWDLPSYCYVDWRTPNEEITTNRSMGRRTIERIWVENIRNTAYEVSKKGTPRCPCHEPQEVRKVEVDEILNFLKDEMKTSSEDDLKNAISRIQSLAEYYFDKHWGNIWEHEARTFLVIPLLLALGWKEEQIKIELSRSGGKVDIACFRENYKGKDVDECVAIIETKSFHIGLDYAIRQINGYVKADREYFRNCNTAIVTNGHCYKVHLRDGDKDVGFNEYPEDPAAYMNIREPNDKYPLDPENVEGTLEALKWLSPNAYSLDSGSSPV